MTSLTIKKLNRNAFHGKFSDVFQKCFGVKKGVHLDLLNQRKPHNPIDYN